MNFSKNLRISKLENKEMKLLERRRKKIFINITSLIDVVLLLLIFFMLTTTFSEQPGLKLDLPETKSFATEKLEELELIISDDGRLILGSEELPIESLAQKLEDVIPSLANKTLVLKADKKVLHGKVVVIMDMAKEAGFEKLIIASKADN